MQSHIKFFLIVFLSVFITFAVLDTIKSIFLITKGRQLVKSSVRFEQVSTQAHMKILVVGDSTAVGTGSKNPSFSTAGRLGSVYPEAEIKNLAINGLKLEGFNTILKNLGNKEKFSLILAQIGANDIIRFHSMKRIEGEAEEAFSLLSQKAEKVIILHSGNIGNSKFFPFYLKPFLSKRSREVREIYITLANKYKITYVDLYTSSSEHLLEEDPKKYYAKDMLHLSDDGYGLWFDEIKKFL